MNRIGSDSLSSLCLIAEPGLWALQDGNNLFGRTVYTLQECKLNVELVCCAEFIFLRNTYSSKFLSVMIAKICLKACE